jgi:hypothetical protein
MGMGKRITFFFCASLLVATLLSVSCELVLNLALASSWVYCKWDTLESTQFIFNKCPIYTHDGARAKFSISWDEPDYSVAERKKTKREREGGSRCNWVRWRGMGIGGIKDDSKKRGPLFIIHLGKTTHLLETVQQTQRTMFAVSRPILKR